MPGFVLLSFRVLENVGELLRCSLRNIDVEISSLKKRM